MGGDQKFAFHYWTLKVATDIRFLFSLSLPLSLSLSLLPALPLSPSLSLYIPSTLFPSLSLSMPLSLSLPLLSLFLPLSPPLSLSYFPAELPRQNFLERQEISTNNRFVASSSQLALNHFVALLSPLCGRKTIKMFFLFFPHYSSCFFSSLRLLETKTGVNYAALVAIVYNIKQLHAYSIGLTSLGCFLASADMVVLATNHSNVGFSP